MRGSAPNARCCQPQITPRRPALPPKSLVLPRKPTFTRAHHLLRGGDGGADHLRRAAVLLEDCERALGGDAGKTFRATYNRPRREPRAEPAMKVFMFHLMPYAYLDMNFSDKYRAAWVVLPNSYFDPKKGHELYNRYLDELELAAELGFDGISVSEHPLTLAEEHAMLDCITGGRLITGMVRGIGAEYYSMGSNPAFSHARFQEA